MRWTWPVALLLVASIPNVMGTSPEAPWLLSLEPDATPRLNEFVTFTVRVEARTNIGNVTIDLVTPPGWVRSPTTNRTVSMREGDVRTLTWVVIPKTEGFWSVRADLKAFGGGATAFTEYYGLLHGGTAVANGDHQQVIPTPEVTIDLRAMEQPGANVTLLAIATPHSSWMKYGTLRAEFGILNATRIATAPGSRGLNTALTEHIPPRNAARGWAQFSFQPNWQTPDSDPNMGRGGIDLGCRDLWVSRDDSPELQFERATDCVAKPNALSPAPGVGVFALIALTVLALRRRSLRPD